MIQEKFKQIVKPNMTDQTLFQLSQMKVFVDASLKTLNSKSFENESEKIVYLLETLYSIRDFVLTQTTENTVRKKLIANFEAIEEREKLGNSLVGQEEKQSQSQEEKSEQNHLESEKKEVVIESTSDS